MSEERKSRYELFLEEEERAAQPTKRCSKCKEVKALSEFHKGPAHTKLKLRPECKVCRSKQNRKYHNREDRFWKHHNARTVQVGNCVEWTGAYSSDGYPRCQYQSKLVSVSRLVYALTNGSLPDEGIILLTCDNKRCVRRSHLKLGTKDDLMVKLANSAPMGDDHYARRHPEKVRRGDGCWNHRHPECMPRGDDHPSRKHPETRPRGEKHALAKLLAPEVRAIRKLYAAGGVSQPELARQFEISRATISAIVNRRIWKHVQ